jgi:hypothetical protein
VGNPDDLIPEVGGKGVLVGAGSYGVYMPAGPIGLFWDLAGPFRLDEVPGLEAFVGPSIQLGPMALQPGVGAVTVGIHDADGTQASILPQPHLGALFVRDLSDSLKLDIGLGSGWAPSGFHAKARWGLRGGAGLGWNGGLELSSVTGRFEEQGSNRRATATAWRVGLRGGVSFGR